MLSEVQKEIEEMKQANTKKSAAIEELKQKNKQKLTRISELEDRICELEGNNGIRSFLKLSCGSM